MSESQVARAYDAVAASYDEQLAADEWVRRGLWAHYARVFQPGQHILDVACGTGSDSLFLAGQGMHVTGIDVSGQMIALTRSKAEVHGLSARIAVQVMDVSELGRRPALLLRPGDDDPPFDGIISGFAGLNTLPKVRPFASAAARLLKPDGHMIVHMLNRFSVWEWLSLLLHVRWRRAFRLGRQSERVFIIGGLPVVHRLYWPRSAYAEFFAPYFSLASAYSVGAFLPPESHVRIPASARRILERMERRWSRAQPFLNCGRFFVLDMVRKAAV